jgi:hypothetical protein
MPIDSFIIKLKSRLDSVADPGEKNRVIADEVAGFFSIRSHEVGLFSVNHKKHEISFLLPAGMASKGHIPLNAVNSLVAKTANTLVPAIDNAFATTRHLFMFEHMLSEKSDRISVQKIMSVPIVAEGVAKGVIQVGRKGVSPVEAGEDFTAHELADLVKIAELLARYGI